MTNHQTTDAWLGNGEIDNAIASRRIRAVGRRPEDFAARDFLLNGPLNHPSMKILRSQMQKSEPLIEEAVAHLADAFDSRTSRTVNLQKHSRRILTYHRHHLFWLKRLQVALIESDTALFSTARRLWNCPPVGMLFAPVNEGDTYLLPCKNARVCPYCLTRNALKLWRKLETLWLREESWRSSLCMLVASVSDEEIFKQRIDDLGDWSSGEEAAAFVRKHAVPKLKQLAKTLGVFGGVAIFQVVPRKCEPRFWGPPESGLEYRVALLGQAQTQLTDLKGTVDRCFRNSEYLHCNGADLRLKCLMGDSNRPALRKLLFGHFTGSDFNPRKEWCAGALTNPCFSLIRTSEECDGVHIPSADHFERFYAATHRVPLYRFFGNCDQRQVHLAAANQARQAAAVEYRDGIEGSAFEIWTECCAKTGRPPGRVIFKEAMVDAGFDVSDRTARELTRQFKDREEPTESRIW